MPDWKKFILFLLFFVLFTLILPNPTGYGFPLQFIFIKQAAISVEPVSWINLFINVVLYYVFSCTIVWVHEKLKERTDFFLNFLTGFLTTLITFVAIQILPTFNLPFNIEKVVVFGVITLLIGLIFLRKKSMSSHIGTLIGGIIAGFIIFNYGVVITSYVINTFLGGTIVGVIGTVLKYVIDILLRTLL